VVRLGVVSEVLRLRGRGSPSTCGCAGAASSGRGLRTGLHRAVGSGGCPGSRAVVRVGRTGLRQRVLSGGSATETLSAVDLPPSQRCTGGRSTAGVVRRGNDASSSWTVPREGRSTAHPTPKRTHERTGPPTHPAARSRPVRRPPPAPAEAPHHGIQAPAAAHQRIQSPRASAPARRARNTPGRDEAPTGTGGGFVGLRSGERQLTRWGACRGSRPSCDARGACGRSCP
jgi:hypothetical protein